jgi:hypothetical protein
MRRSEIMVETVKKCCEVKLSEMKRSEAKGDKSRV